MYKRALLSVTRRTAKTLLLLVIVFIIANLVLASTTVKKATDEAMVFARRSLGGNVSIVPNIETLRNELQNEGWDPRFGMHPLRVKMLSVSSSINDVKTLETIEYVTAVKYGFISIVRPVGFDIFDIASRTFNSGPGGGRGRNDLIIESINSFELLSSYANGEITLVDGRIVNSNDEFQTVISNEFANQNNLKVNDRISIENSEGKRFTFGIIGIFENKINDEYTNNYNTMYTTIGSGVKLLTGSEYNNGNYKVNNPTFFLNDPINIEKFIAEAGKRIPDLQSRYLLLDANNATYTTLIGPIKGVGDFSNIFMWIVFIASVIIISLIVINSIKERNYELGVLLSLGEKKIKIAGQFLFELLLIATVAISLSLVTSIFISKSMGDILLENQLKSYESRSVSQSGSGGMFGRYNPAMFSKGKPIDKINIAVDSSDVVNLFLIGYVIIIVSSFVPAAVILKSDPKQILSRRDG